MDTEAFINEVAQRLINYIALKDEDDKVKPSLPMNSLRRTLDVNLPLEGHGMNRVLDDLDTYIQQSVKTHKPEFMNPLWGGLSLPALAGEMIASATNNSMYTFELSPMGCLLYTSPSPRDMRRSRMPSSA